MSATIADVLTGKARWCVLQGDNREFLGSIPDKSVDEVITDPPYHARAMKNARSNGETMKQRRDGVVIDFGYAALDASARAAASAEFGRIARRWVIVWTDIESDHLWRFDLEATGLEYIRLGIWHRINSAPQFSGDRPSHNVEACVIAHPRGRKRWNGGGRPAFWSHNVVNSQAEERVHSSPKPLELMLEQIADFTDPNDVVLDPFCGSGTTGVACLRLGRRFIGMELNAKYAAVSRERLEAESQGLSLRDARAGQLPMFGGSP